MPHGAQRMRYKDLLRQPAGGSRRELYDGALLSIPQASPEHDAVVARLETGLRTHIARHGGQVLRGPMALVFSPTDVVQPDLVFFHASRTSLIHDVPPIRHAPDLIAEVLASNTATIDRGPKMAMFARYGVLEYWLVDPEPEGIEVHVLRGDRYELFQEASLDDIVRSTILVGLEMDARQTFRGAS